MLSLAFKISNVHEVRRSSLLTQAFYSGTEATSRERVKPDKSFESPDRQAIENHLKLTRNHEIPSNMTRTYGLQSHPDPQLVAFRRLANHFLTGRRTAFEDGSARGSLYTIK